ncbi:MAG: hypothetical protein AAF329_19365 [Cyanobacteria bacterium P01_A01_bin.17]
MNIPGNDSSQNNQAHRTNPNPRPVLNAEIIRASTPISLAIIGGIIGITVLWKAPDDTSAGFGLASTAIAGAAGLAQPNKGLRNK